MYNKEELDGLQLYLLSIDSLGLDVSLKEESDEKLKLLIEHREELRKELNGK